MNRANAWLRLEGGAALLAATLAYSVLGGDKLWFMILLLVPDVSLAGYIAGQRAGALVYNLGHSYVSPGALALLGFINDSDTLLQGSLIWIAHIGFDRLLGFGLKTGQSFKHTHLGVIGPKKK